jgi:hypothetical protein
MAISKNPRHEAFAQALARGMSATAAYVEAGFKPSRHNAAALARRQHVSSRVAELQEEQLAIHQQSVAAAVVNAQVTIEGLIADAEAARIKAMAEKGGAAAAVSAVTVKAKLAGMWRDRVDQHNTGNTVLERIERVIVEHKTDDGSRDAAGAIGRRANGHTSSAAGAAEPSSEPLSAKETEREIRYAPPAAPAPRRHWSD